MAWNGSTVKQWRECASRPARRRAGCCFCCRCCPIETRAWRVCQSGTTSLATWERPVRQRRTLARCLSLSSHVTPQRSRQVTIQQQPGHTHKCLCYLQSTAASQREKVLRTAEREPQNPPPAMPRPPPFARCPAGGCASLGGGLYFSCSSLRLFASAMSSSLGRTNGRRAPPGGLRPN